MVKNDASILSKLDSIETQLFDIGAWWTLHLYITSSDDRNVQAAMQPSVNCSSLIILGIIHQKSVCLGRGRS